MKEKEMHQAPAAEAVIEEVDEDSQELLQSSVSDNSSSSDGKPVITKKAKVENTMQNTQADDYKNIRINIDNNNVTDKES